MLLKKYFAFLLLACYCFSSNILTHNAAMHHLHSNDHHDEVAQTIIEDNCCDESTSHTDTGCFKKCMGEFTKIFTTKINLQQFKHLASIVYVPKLLTETIVPLLSYTVHQQNKAPPNIFLSSYIVITKNILYG